MPETIRLSDLKHSLRRDGARVDYESEGGDTEEVPLGSSSYSCDSGRPKMCGNAAKTSSRRHCSYSCFMLPYRWKIRIKAILILCILGIPGNFVTVALLINPSTQSNSTSSTEMLNRTSTFFLDNDTSFCYENITKMIPIMDNSSYWIEGVSLAIIGTIGLIGNSLTLLVLGLYESKSSFNALLMSLVTMDTVLVVFYLFDSGYISAFKNEEPEWYKYMFPYFWHPLRNICSTACIYMVVAVATERHHAICHPMRYKPSPLFYLGIVGGISFLVNISKFFEFELQNTGQNSTGVVYWTTSLNEDVRYVVFNSYHECVVSGIFPLLALCFLNFRIYSKIRKSSRMKHRYVGGRSTSSTRTIQSSSASIISNHNTKRVDSCPDSARRPTVRLLSVNTQIHGGRQRERPSISLSGSPTNVSHIEFAPVDDTSLSSFKHRNNTAPETTTSSSKVPPNNSKHFQSRKEKSTGILICIILVFVACHVIKLGIQMYEIFSPSHGLNDYFEQCKNKGRLHVPAVLHILGNLNHLCLVFNSSVNFLIYCCMAKKFRSVLEKLFFRNFSR